MFWLGPAYEGTDDDEGQRHASYIPKGQKPKATVRHRGLLDEGVTLDVSCSAIRVRLQPLEHSAAKRDSAVIVHGGKTEEVPRPTRIAASTARLPCIFAFSCYAWRNKKDHHEDGVMDQRCGLCTCQNRLSTKKQNGS